MRASSILRLVACASVASVATAAKAQSVVGRDCAVSVKDVAPDSFPGWVAQHPRAVLAQVQPALARGNFSVAFDTLLHRLDVWPVPLDATARNSMRANLTQTRDDLRAVERSSDRARLMRTAEGTTLVRYQYSGPRFVVFTGTADSINLAQLADSGQRRAVCWTALAAHQVLQLYAHTSRESIAARLDTLRRWWDAYRDVRYSAYPWELALSGIGRGRSLEPPRTQVVLVHPAVGVKLGGISLDSLRQKDINADNAVVIEWLGLVRYTDDWQSLRGASVISSLTSAGGWDIGALLHVSSKFRIGATYQRIVVDGASRGRYALVTSLDLYKRVSRLATPGG